ncbi:MAG: Glu/Leu/Phe/Val dehydrogenase dimerization domain-containing protein [Pseudomonadota bacterium]
MTDACTVRNNTNAAHFLTELDIYAKRFQDLAPELELTLRDPEMGVEGYVVVWNTGISAGGPLEFSGKGGTRITPTLTLDEVKMLARTMALKNAAAGLPMGGAKSGLRADPNAPGFEKLYRRFVRLCAPTLRENNGPYGGFGFDIGGQPEHALWATDELKSERCFTGKPVDRGGTDYDREGIAGLGVATSAVAALAFQGRDPAAVTFAVQGIGAMGAAVIRYFTAHGARLSGIGDPRLNGSWVFNTQPDATLMAALSSSDVPTILATLGHYAQQVSLDANDILLADTDILFPCAVHNVIRPDNMAQVKAGMIVEGANGPTHADCYAPLAARGILVIPDFIANAGGIIAAYVELTSPISTAENARFRTKVEEAKKTTIAKITENVTAILVQTTDLGVTPREAGLHLAYRRIFNEEGRGEVV